MTKLDDSKKVSMENMEQVAGGTAVETSDDSKFLNKLANLCDRYGSGMVYWSNEVKQEVTDAWAKVGVRFVRSDYKTNQYFIGDKEVSQADAMAHAQSVIGVQLKPEDWK